jgi:Cyclin
MGNEDERRQEGGEMSQQKSATPPLPKPPQPERDAGIVPEVKSPLAEDAEIDPDNLDIFTLAPVAALKLLCRSVDTLVQMTGDIPPTPPARSAGPSPSPGASGLRNSVPPDTSTPWKENNAFGSAFGHQEQIDGVPFVKTPIGSPEAHPQEPTSVIGAHTQPVHIQHGAIARKFWSKRPPPISLEDYLMRMHKYCPMSTAVYLATSCYISRLVVKDHIVPITPRNVHRLILAGLRVAMKALEDLSWPHARFSKVGGVSESELGRLEITFCFLMDFTLKVDEQMLYNEAEALLRTRRTDESAVLDSPVSMELKLPGEKPVSRGGEKRKASSALPSRPAIQVGKGIEVMGQS